MSHPSEQVSIQTEICLRVANTPCALATVMTIAGNCPSEVLAFCSSWEHDRAVVLLVSDKPAETQRALMEAGLDFTTNSVVLVGPESQPGIAVELRTELDRANIAVLYSYTCQTDGDRTFVVLRTTDDERALRVLKVNVVIRQIAVARSRRGGGLKPNVAAIVENQQAA